MKKIMLLTTILIQSSAVLAAGYQLQEYTVTGLGRAMAGVGVMGDDYSALTFNPAGMQYNDKSGAQFGLIGVDLRSKVKGTQTVQTGTALDNTKKGQDYTHIFRLLPHAFGQYKLNDKTTLGIGLYTPFGLATDYRNNWYASAQGQYSGITVVNLTPAISYNITDKIALGLGVNLQYAVAHLTGATFDGGSTNMKHADDTNVGYTIGLTFKPWESTRFGISYRSKVHHKLHGKNSGRSGLTELINPGHGTGFLNGTHKVHADITTPETIIISAAHDLNKSWTLSGTARFTRWSRFRDLDIYQDNYPNPGPLSNTHEHWRNTWFFALGADYKFCKNITLRFGTAYDQTAIKSPKYRTVRIPDQRRIWTSLGATYQRDNWQLDVGYAHLFVHDAHGTAQTGYVKTDSTWETQSNILGLQFQYKF